MAYQVSSSEIAILYNNASYVVNLTSDPNSFQIKSTDGIAETVDANTAAHLFGAEKAYSLLTKLYGTLHVDHTSADWASILQIDAEIVGLSAVNNIVANASGLVLGGLFTGGLGTGVTIANAGEAFLDLTKSMAPNLAELAYVYGAVTDANHLLTQAAAEYNAINNIISSSRNTPISYDNIKQAIDNTLVALYVGDAASQAAQRIPVVSQNTLDDLSDFAGSLAGSLTNSVSKIAGFFSQAQGALLSSASDGADLIAIASDVSDLSTFINTVTTITDGLEGDGAKYAPLTGQGLANSAAALAGKPAVTPTSHVSVYSISPNAKSFNENSGTVTFTISRTDASQAATVFVSTVHDQGIDNPNNNYYYNGILNQQIAFAQGTATAQVHLTINDLGLTSGAEAFRVIVQQNSSDPITISLASDTFTIVNNDLPPPSSYSVTPNAPKINESAGIATFTITRTNTSQAVTVYASTVHDQGTDNPNGIYFYNGLLNKPITFAAGVATAQVELTINDRGLTSGSENFRLIVQQHSTDPVSTSLASDTFTILNNDAGIIANATVNESVNTTFLLQPFLTLPPLPSGLSLSVVNFINTHSGPGELAIGGNPTSGNVAVGYSSIGQVGFSTGSVTGSDKIEMYATYSDGTSSSVVDLTVNILASPPPPPPPPQNSSGPIVNSNVQPLQVIVGHQGALTASNLSASDAAYPDPSLITYNITDYPTKGIIYNNGQLAHSFTQADIDAGHVVYQANMQVGLNSEVTDSFQYVVSDPSFRQSPITTASLGIEPLPPPPQTDEPYIDTNVFQIVPEGGQIFVLGNRYSVQNLHVTDPNPNDPYTGSSRDSAIVYTIVQGPTHGQLVWFTSYPTLWLPGQSPYFGQPVTQFTQNDLNNGWFVYQNDFTSGASDSFSFTVSDGFGGAIGLTTATIPIQPVNPIHLAINAGMFVTSGGQSWISPDWLRVYDSAPNPNLIFTVKQAPSHGTLLSNGNPVSSFTPNQVGIGFPPGVEYRQDGGPAQSDQFVLGVTDAYGNGIADLLVPVTIAANALDRNTGAIVDVGQSVSIDGTNLHVFDPGMGSGNPNADTPPYLIYTLTALPTHGALSTNGSTLHIGDQFTQDQIDKALLNYTEDGSTATSDSFGFSISDAFVHNNFGSSTFDITIVGTNGGRIFTGSSTPEIFYSGPGNNWIEGGSGTTVSYTLAPAGVNVNLATGTASNGFGGIDTISGVHSVIGSPYGDTLRGTSSNDTLNGGAGVDTMIGGLGNDTYYVDNAGDKITEAVGGGTDTVYAGVNYTLKPGVEVENLYANAGATGLKLTGNEFDNHIVGGTGVDTLTGGGGNDTLDGGAGADKLVGGLGNDSYYVDNAADKITEATGQGTDTVYASVNYTLKAGVEVENLYANAGATGLKLTGNEFDNHIVGGAGVDNLIGGDGKDTLDGSGGLDKLTGGAGDDIYIINNTGVHVTELSGGGSDTVKSSISYTLGANLEDLTLTGNAAINGIGNTLDNTITGNDAANTLKGGDGADTLIGGGGRDMLFGGAGNDTFKFQHLSNTGATGATADQIKDFATGDLIDLRDMESDTGIAFNFIGGAPFAHAGDVRAFASGANTIVAGHITGGVNHIDFEIVLAGAHTLTLHASDFLL